MRKPRRPSGRLDDPTVPVQAKLAAMWTSLMFLYIYVDILSLYQPGGIDGIRDDRVWELDISETWAVGALALMAIPILMGILSLTLPARANRTANLVVATLYAAVSIGNAVGETWTYYFAFAVGLELAVLALVGRHAWTWPRAHPPTIAGHQTDGTSQLVTH